MGRFYSTTQRNFQDDFIFEPNLDLAMMALAKKDQDIKDQINTLDLFENLPIDYWKDADGENAERIKSEYEQRVSDIAKTMQGDLTNTGANQRLINNLRRDIAKDYEFGNIRNIQDNAAAYRQFDEMLKSMPNPADREGYKRQIQDYLDSTEGKGALSSVFKPEELYNSRDLWGEFTKSGAFAGLKPDEKSSQVVNVGGQWLVKKGNSLEQLSESKIGQAFKAFIDSNNLQGYGQSRQKYFNEKWLDEEGNIRMDSGSYLGDILGNGVPSLAYSKSASSQDVNVNPYEMASYQASLQEAAAKRAEKRAQTAAQISNIEYGDSSSKKVLNSLLFKGEKDAAVKSKLDLLSKSLNMKVTLKNIPQILEIANKYKNNDHIKKELGSILAMNKEGIRASYSPLYEMGFSKAYVDSYQNNLQTAVEKKGFNVKGVLDLSGANLGIDNTLSRNLTLNELKQGRLGNYIIEDATIIPGSSTPLFFGYDETKNKIQSTVALTLRNKDDESEEPITREVDFYQSSYDITGTSAIDKDIINKYYR